MYKKIFKQIKKYENIVIARHIGVDPDAMASQVALQESIKLTFPDKNVFTTGAGTVRFNYIGKLDKNVNFEDYKDILLIILDTPDKKRVDMGDLKEYKESIKIDHHIYIETFCDLEYIDDNKSSASEIVYDLIQETGLKMNEDVAKKLFYGIVADTNRFLFNKDPDTFRVVADIIEKYNFDITELYKNMYMKPMMEERLEGYMAVNMQVTENGVGYIKMPNEVMVKYQMDSVSSGDIINNFNYINELLVWLSANEDIKNNCIRVSIRSRGPVINHLAEKYNGGGHKLACGARVPSYDEVDQLIAELDDLCKSYIESSDNDENK